MCVRACMHARKCVWCACPPRPFSARLPPPPYSALCSHRPTHPPAHPPGVEAVASLPALEHLDLSDTSGGKHTMKLVRVCVAGGGGQAGAGCLGGRPHATRPRQGPRGQHPRLGHQAAHSHVVHVVVGVADGQPLKEAAQGERKGGQRRWGVRCGKIGRIRGCTVRRQQSRVAEQRAREVCAPLRQAHASDHHHPVPVELQQRAQQLQSVAAAASQKQQGEGCLGFRFGQMSPAPASLPAILSAAPAFPRLPCSTRWRRRRLTGASCPHPPAGRA